MRHRRSTHAVMLAIAVLLSTGCGDGGDGSAPAAAEVVLEPTPAGAWREGATADGTWKVAWRPLADPIPTLDPFSIEVRVTDPAGGEPPQGTVVLVDASMPHHGHGMNVVPRIVRGDEGWIAEGMLLHMPGRWEFVVDVEHELDTERAQWTLMLDQ